MQGCIQKFWGYGGEKKTSGGSSISCEAQKYKLGEARMTQGG